MKDEENNEDFKFFFPANIFTLPHLIFPVTCFCLFYEKILKKKLVLQVKGQKKSISK